MSENSHLNLKNYWPLICLIAVAALMGISLCIATKWTLFNWMHFFMGSAFAIFATLKLFNISGFADGFQMYDLLARNSRTYAQVYPFIELFLGLLYLSFLIPIITYSLTVLLMTIGTIGVVKALKRDLKINCACMGTVLNVPLSTVTLTEDLGMGLMALFMLISRVI